MTYAEIKSNRKESGEKASAEQLDAAIKHQSQVYGDAATAFVAAKQAALMSFVAVPEPSEEERKAVHEAAREADKAVWAERRRLAKLRRWRYEIDHPKPEEDDDPEDDDPEDDEDDIW